MKVLLLQDVRGVGRKNDVVEAKAGYARNFLLPKKLAVLYQGPAVTAKAQVDAKAQELLDKAKQGAERLEKEKLVFKVKAGDDGQVFGGVSAVMIEDRLAQMDLTEAKAELAHTLKELGEHKVGVNFGHNIKGAVTVVLEKE